MARQVKAVNGSTVINGTFIDDTHFKIDFGAQSSSDVVWNITYTDDDGCEATTTYKVKGTTPCSISSVICNPSQAQLNNGTATTTITVNGSQGCNTDWKIKNRSETGHSGSNFTVNAAGVYTAVSVSNTSITATFTVTEPASCEITNITITPTEYELSDTHRTASTRVVVQGTEQCDKTWKAWKLVNSDHGWTRDPSYTPVTGDTNTDFETQTAGRYSIFSTENESVERIFMVTSAPTFETSFEVGIDSDYGNYACYSNPSPYVRQSRTSNLRIEIDASFSGNLTLNVTVEPKPTAESMKLWIWDNIGTGGHIQSVGGGQFIQDGVNRWSAYVESVSGSANATIITEGGGTITLYMNGGNCH